MSKIPDLTYNSPIRAAAWLDIFFAKTFTLKGWCEDQGRDLDKAIERAKRLGHETVATIFTGPCLLGDREEAARQNAKLRATCATAATVKNGDLVRIDGVLHRVRFARGNEFANAPINSDPIAFVLVSDVETLALAESDAA